jgi:hypothetical protein
MANKILREMMEELDGVADQIPEGFYLKMCDCAKRLHETLPVDEEPTAPLMIHYQEWNPSMSNRRCGICRQYGHDRRSCVQPKLGVSA